ncbi:H-NS histone family protein [Comamonas antarctica]|uniref:H-NS histone family protein n=1 Tax=Comamonas antarctica TaxID=2743470 RepID=UPI0028E27EE4|nr:H-NS histone family protein [Comamonas antarctica]
MQKEQLEALKAQRALLDQQIAAAEKESRNAVIAQARELLATVGLVCDVRSPYTSKAHPTTGKKVPPKFRHKATGATWTGRGKAPTWYANASSQDEIEVLGGAA